MTRQGPTPRPANYNLALDDGGVETFDAFNGQVDVIGLRVTMPRNPIAIGLLLARHSARQIIFPAKQVIHSNVTFIAWVRVDVLTQPNSALIVAEGPLRWHSQMPAPTQIRRPPSVPLTGLFRWELRYNGIMSFNVVRHQEGRNVQWDMTRTPPVLTSEWLDQWVQLAVTHDASRGEVTHYFNGRIAARVTLKKLLPLSLDLLELGNLHRGNGR